MARLRARRNHAELLGGEFGWMPNEVFPPGFPRFGLRSRNLGDYMVSDCDTISCLISCLTQRVEFSQRDEDLDTSYEGLLQLSGLLGEARPRGISDSVLSSLPSGTYQDWAKPGETEERCPICLDDVRISVSVHGRC